MGYPILTVQEMRDWEASSWEAGLNPRDVIQRAGSLIAKAILERTRPNDRVLLVAGPGNNGNDARACALQLTDRDTLLIDVTDPELGLSQLRQALDMPFSLLLDGVFGIGLNRNLEGPWRQIIELLNLFRCQRIALDCPSGLDADTGRARGACFEADETWTLGAPKAGLIAEKAPPFTGRIRVFSDLGLIGRPVASSPLLWMADTDFGRFPSPRNVDGHKGSFGHAAVVAGSSGYHGSAVLATYGALRARPGLTSCIVQPEILAVVAAQLAAPMVRAWTANLRLPETTTSLLLGPGLAATELSIALRDWSLRLWNDFEAPLIFDASSLAWLPKRVPISRYCRVITPHPGEAASLLGCKSEQVQADRLTALRLLSRQLGNVWVILKGYQTLIGRSEGPVWINSTGNIGLAQGGTGDVLAGFLGGLLAQPRLASIPERTLPYAVWEHGAAADRLERRTRNWTSEDLAEEIGSGRSD